MRLKLDRRAWMVASAIGTLVVAVPTSVAAYVRIRDSNRRLQLTGFLADPLAGDDGWVQMPWLSEEEAVGEAEGDDARRRQIATRIMWGVKSPEASAELAKTAHAEYRKWWPLFSGAPPAGRPAIDPRAIVSGQSWVNLGPTDSAFNWNGGFYPGVSSGRVSGISVNPSDPTNVIIGTSGGGMWKTNNFGAADPTWTPIGESLPGLAIGAIKRDPSDPNTLYAGLGDFIDTPGGQMVKTTDGGASWSSPVQLSGTYPVASGGLAAIAQRIRWVEVDPNAPSIVLVGTDVGLFRSTDAGASYALLDLPNADGAAAQRPESVWTIQYTGQAAGISNWVASGVPSCGPAFRPSDPGSGVLPGADQPGTIPATVCTFGNLGDIWVSTDAGATWTSRRSAGPFPAPEPDTPVGRITLAAGTPVGTTATVYAQLSVATDSDGAGYWRSLDSGNTWTQIASSDSAVTNPPLSPGHCPDSNVVSGQASYNAALQVDPGDDNVLVAGGMLCGMRTLNGKAATPTFNLISHWLPAVDNFGDTSFGTLPYVHADWHRVVIVRVGAKARVLAGCDGGLFWSDDALSAAIPETATWNHANRGLPTHLSYSVASGDPATGDPFLAYTGLQDNGTRFRDPTTTSTTFNEVIGGDGFGAAAGRDAATGNSVYWASVNGHHAFCVPSAANAQCNQGIAWSANDPTLTSCPTGSEGRPFVVRYAAVPTNPTPNTFLTISNRRVWRISGTGTWTAISPCLSDGTTVPISNRNVGASQNIDGFYGLAISQGRFAVTSDCAGANTACTWTISSQLWFDSPAFGGNGDGVRQPLESMSFTSMVAFPPGPTGSPVGDIYLGSTMAPLMDDFTRTVPASLGHLFRTTDRGATWTPFHGNGAGFDLPNVGVGVIRYDPADLTNNTIYAGTELGVYRTTDGGNTWHRYGVGLPMVLVDDMFIGRTGALLRIATYGRGLWEIYPNATAEHGVNGNGDWDRNLQIDFIDLGAMASRLGTDPSASTAPLYDWNDDMTGTVNGIDEADLSALLANFGNKP
ncbi:MAG TPA: hypothetical protein VIG99_28935 [Myxococcaceae bacterium]